MMKLGPLSGFEILCRGDSPAWCQCSQRCQQEVEQVGPREIEIREIEGDTNPAGEQVECWRETDRDTSAQSEIFKEVSRQDLKSCEIAKDRLAGVWSYAANPSYKYRLTALGTDRTQYLFEERHGDGKKVQATITQNGECFEGSASKEDKALGKIRLRLQDGQVVTNFLTPSNDTWGEDCFAIADGLEGMWSYSAGIYKITAVDAFPLHYFFEEEHADGDSAQARLFYEDGWYEGPVSKGGQAQGHVRLHRKEDTIISNFRVSNESDWGEDMVATTSN